PDAQRPIWVLESVGLETASPQRRTYLVEASSGRASGEQSFSSNPRSMPWCNAGRPWENCGVALLHLQHVPVPQELASEQKPQHCPSPPAHSFVAPSFFGIQTSRKTRLHCLSRQYILLALPHRQK